LLGTASASSVAVLDDTADVEAGLDALDAVETDRAPWHRRFGAAVWPPLVAIAALVAVWGIAARLSDDASLLPTPGEVWNEFSAGWSAGTIPEAMLASAGRGLLGFAIAIVLAIPIGLAIARFGPVRLALSPLMLGLQTLPSVAWVPAATLAFGAGDAAVYTVVLLGGIPSIAMGLVAGLDQTPALYPRVGRVLGAKRLSMTWFILLPAAAPAFLSGLRQGWAFAWRSLMAAELIAGATSGNGLGGLLQDARAADSMSAILAAVLAILIIGLVIETCFFSPIERHLLRSRGLAGATR
jgi:NitT/TauT family transport system permease protein